DSLRGHRRRRARLARRRLRRLVADRPYPDLRRGDGRLPRRAFRPGRASLPRRPLAGDDRADRADHSLSPARGHPDRPADRPHGDAGHVTRPARFLWPWLSLAAAFALAPAVFSSAAALTVLSVMGVMIIFALSYNMLLGQTGLLSFGHAVYYGLGGFAAIHAMNAVIHDKLGVPVVVIPMVGGLAGLAFGVLFGLVSTRRAGLVFSMISLGVGELVSSSSFILRTFFGGEEGITTNRAKLAPLFGLKFGPQTEVYYLIAIWCFLCIAAMYALTRT